MATVAPANSPVPLNLAFATLSLASFFSPPLALIAFAITARFSSWAAARPARVSMRHAAADRDSTLRMDNPPLVQQGSRFRRAITLPGQDARAAALPDTPSEKRGRRKDEE